MSEKREVELSFGAFMLLWCLLINSCSQGTDIDRIADALDRMAPPTTDNSNSQMKGS